VKNKKRNENRKEERTTVVSKRIFHSVKNERKISANIGLCIQRRENYENCQCLDEVSAFGN